MVIAIRQPYPCRSSTPKAVSGRSPSWVASISQLRLLKHGSPWDLRPFGASFVAYHFQNGLRASRSACSRVMPISRNSLSSRSSKACRCRQRSCIRRTNGNQLKGDGTRTRASRAFDDAVRGWVTLPQDMSHLLGGARQRLAARQLTGRLSLARNPRYGVSPRQNQWFNPLRRAAIAGQK